MTAQQPDGLSPGDREPLADPGARGEQETDSSRQRADGYQEAGAA